MPEVPNPVQKEEICIHQFLENEFVLIFQFQQTAPPIPVEIADMQPGISIERNSSPQDSTPTPKKEDNIDFIIKQS